MSGNGATEVEVRDNPKLHRFEVDLGNGQHAVAIYNLLTAKIMFTHTEVPEAYEGRGIGTALIRAGLNAARERGLQVIPTCPFFASYIKRHPEEQDLLEPAYRSVLGLDR
jgi:predicted GNAT family acetyltransferase